MTRSLTGRDGWSAWALLLIVTVAFIVRLALNIQFQGLDSRADPDLGPDAVNYSAIGESLAAGQGYALHGQPSLHYPPGVPLLLAVIWTPGVSYAAARIVFSLLGALTCLVAALVAWRLGGRTAGLLAGAGLAVYPEHAYWSMHFYPEVPLGLVYAALALAAIRQQHTPGAWWPGALVGILFALSALLSPRSLPIVAVYFLLLLVYRRVSSVRTAVAYVAIPCLFFALTLAPWVVRNYRLTGTFVLISSHGGSTLLDGNNPKVFADPAQIGGWYRGPMSDVPGFSALQRLPEAERSAAATRLAIDALESLTPGELAYLEAMKLYKLLSPVMDTPNRPYRLAVAVTWSLLGPLALLGLLMLWRDPRMALPLGAIGAYLLLTVVFFGEPRYRACLAPFFVVAAACWLATRLPAYNPHASSPKPS